MSSLLGNRLAGLPKIPKIKKKPTSSKTTTKAPRSPPKAAAKPVAPAPPPPSAPPSSSTSTPAPATPSFPIELSDDDSLSELESSSESSSSESESASDDSDDSEEESESESEEPTPSVPSGLPSLSSLVLPPLPPLPPLPSLLPVASTSSSSSSLPKPSPSSTTKPPAPVASSSSSSAAPPPRPKSSKPAASTSTSSSSARPKPSSSSSMIAPSDLAYSPSNPTPRSSNSTSGGGGGVSSSTGGSGAPQRMSLRQVLALSLQEAEDQKMVSSRENTPDANEIMNLAKGKKAATGFANSQKDKEKRNRGGEKGGNESDSSLSSMSSANSSSFDAAGAENGSEADEENGIGNMEKEEERLLRAEMEKRKKGKGKAVASFEDSEEEGFGANTEEDDDDEEEDEDGDEELMDAWEKNVRAMEQFRKKRKGGGGADISFDRQSDGDSDVAVTDLPPGNGFGVVTWSDYDSFGSDDDDEVEKGGRRGSKESEEDQLAEVLLAEKAGLAGEFEEELEQLFALSEAVVGPIRQGEYDAGDMWFEALSDYDGSTADDETEEGDGDDLDAEMIFGEDGELKRMFGARKKRRFSAVDSSAGESESNDSDGTESEEEKDVELVRVGVHLDGEKESRRRGDEETDETESYHSEDDETESSCSDTDIYRYAPRTGALANLQAPTTADLASLTVEDPTPSTSSSSRPKPPFAPRRPSAPSTLEVPTFDHKKGKAKANLPTFKRRLPKMGTFDTTERKNQASESDSGPKIVVVGSGDELAPSPFRVPARKTKSRPILSPRRERSDSRVSTTSGTSGSTSLDPGSNVGSPVLGNVVFPDFDLDSLLQDSVFDATDDEQFEDTALQSVVDAGGATSSETDTGPVASKPPPLDFSRWNRIPIGAFRSRTMGGTGRNAPSQVLTAQAAATELRKNKHKRRNSTSTTADSSRKKVSNRRGGSEDEVASSILRDHKAVKSSLRHTLGTTPTAAGNGKKRKTIRSRMLTSPVLAPTLPSSKPSSSSLAAVAAAVFNKNKKRKKNRSSRSKSPGTTSSSRVQSRQNSTVPPPLPSNTSTSRVPTNSTPSSNLLPLHSPLFPKLEI